MKPKVSAVVVTRGDVALDPILDSLACFDEIVVWNNGTGECSVGARGNGIYAPVLHTKLPDLGVYGRYEALKYASNDVVYVQDDDCQLQDPCKIIAHYESGIVATNLPYAFRSQERDVFTMLVGFGAIFDRGLAQRIFADFHRRWPDVAKDDPGFFQRTSDIIFWAVAQTKVVHLPLELLPTSYADNRMWRQPDHDAERRLMLAMAEVV